jgi:hypothetical protein
MAAPAMADDFTASVTVNTYASVTITDNGASGLAFGSLDPGTDKQAEAASPSVSVTTSSENNVDIAISISGTNFSDGGTNSFAVSNAFYNTTDVSGSAVAMSTTPTQVGSDLTPGDGMDIYHWLTIPANQAAASYSSTFTYTSSY